MNEEHRQKFSGNSVLGGPKFCVIFIYHMELFPGYPTESDVPDSSRILSLFQVGSRVVYYSRSAVPFNVGCEIMILCNKNTLTENFLTCCFTEHKCFLYENTYTKYQQWGNDFFQEQGPEEEWRRIFKIAFEEMKIKINPTKMKWCGFACKSGKLQNM